MATIIITVSLAKAVFATLLVGIGVFSGGAFQTPIYVLPRFHERENKQCATPGRTREQDYDRHRVSTAFKKKKKSSAHFQQLSNMKVEEELPRRPKTVCLFVALRPVVVVLRL